MANLKWKEADEIPLMDENENKIIANEEVAFAGDDGDDDEDAQEKPFKLRDITLWLSDAIVLVVEHLQYYAIFLALSEHWGWPINWVNATSFTFIFNFDIWEFRKVETGAFNRSRTSFLDSKTMGFNYVSYLAAWAVMLCIIGGIFAGIYIRWMKQRPLYLLLYVARWKRVMFLVLQFLCIPFGIAAARVFHCRLEISSGKTVMDVQNEYECYSGVHVSFMVLILIIYASMYLMYPTILIRWIQDQVFSGDPVRHEGYLQLKEAEYEQGLNIAWDIGQYHLFSSHRRAWVYYNPLKFIFKCFIIVGFALSKHSTFWSSAGMTVIFVLATFSLIIKRPYRVRCFNVMIICSHFILAANALIGNFMVRPPWENPEQFQIVSFLRYPAIVRLLAAINVTWLVILIMWLFYLFLLNNGLIRKERIWPRLSYDSSNTIGEDTKKYLKAALKARHTLEHALAAIPLFAPIHELSHQVKVINAYCREAEYIGDPTHDTLWDLLDELIEAHNALAPVSVFGMSGKNSIRETSEEFIKLMPSFKKRLKQREYDFILVPPVKRRLLLKMYILSVFVSNKKKHVSTDKEVSTKLQEALAMFDGRSLDDYDTGLGSTSPSSISAFTSRSQVMSAQSHSDESQPRSVTQSRPESNMTEFLTDLDNITHGYAQNKVPHKNSLMANERNRSFSKTSKELPMSPKENKKSKTSAGTSQLRQVESPVESKLSISSSSSSKSNSRDGQRKNSLRGNKVSPLTSQSSDSSKFSLIRVGEVGDGRPSSAPLSPHQSRTSSAASLTRPGTAPNMSSTISLPGQIEEEDARETKPSTTVLE